MKQYLTAIIEDDPEYSRFLEECLVRYGKEHGCSFLVRAFGRAEAFLSGAQGLYDFVFMDVELGEGWMNGIEAARALRAKGSMAMLFFITNMPQYAIEAYAVEAMDYVLKPISYPDFHLKMKKAERYILRNADTPLLLQAVSGPVRYNASEILYIESRSHYLYYHTATEEIRVRGKLGDLVDSLLPYHFARAGESFLVNLQHLKAINGNEILVGSERLPISRRYRAAFLSAFTRYLGGF